MIRLSGVSGAGVTETLRAMLRQVQTARAVEAESEAPRRAEGYRP